MDIFSAEEYLKIIHSPTRYNEIINVFKNSEEFNNHLKIIDKYTNDGFINVVNEYLMDTTDYSVINVFHFTIISLYIFLGKCTPSDNRTKICSELIFVLGKVESDNHRNISREMYYGAISYGMNFFLSIASKLDKNEFYQQVELSLKWQNYTACNLIWWRHNLKAMEKFINDKQLLENSCGVTLPISDLSYNEIKSRHNSVLNGKIEIAS